MAKEEFGKTWWGAQWLNAIGKLDYTNRISRGKAYARNGSVLSLKIEQGIIQAVVEGNRPTPYKVSMTMATFSPDQVDMLVKKIMEYPTILSKLQNGKIDPLLLEICDEIGIKIFPAGSKDIQMKCTCPDHAIPCKHIAAVVYKVCSDFDNNPFLLFDFRNIHLLALLKSKNLGFNNIELEKITSFATYVNEHTLVWNTNVIFNNGIDYSMLSNRHSELMQLLENEPPFYALGNFKVIYNNMLLKVAKTATKILNENEDLVLYTKENFIQNPDFDLVPNLIWDGNTVISDGLPLAQIFCMDNENLSYFHPSVADIQSFIQLALKCLSCGLITPKILELNKKYYILWQPALIDQTLNTIVQNFKSRYGIVIDDQRNRADTLLTLSLFLTHFMHLLSSADKKATEIIDAVFFERYGYKFNDLSESSIPSSIQNWTKLFEWDLGDYEPILEINESETDSFSIDIKIAKKGESINLPVSFSQFIGTFKDQQKLLQFYKDLDLLSVYIEGVSEYINQRGENSIVLEDKAFIQFLFNIKPVMALLGIQVVLPKSMRSIIKPKASVSISSKDAKHSSGILGLSKLLEFDWQISLGDQLVSVSEFKNLVTQAGKLIKYRGQYVFISESEMAALQKQLSRKDAVSNVELLHAALGEEYEGSSIYLTNEVKVLIDQLSKIELIDPPSSMTASLRPYQLRGFSWMVKNAKIGIGSIIADDMGLGKTLQVITFITYLIEQKMMGNKKALIIVPTSLIPNWEAEFQKFSPSVNYLTYYGNNRVLDKENDADVIITSYGLLRSDVKEFASHHWSLITIDEAQNIKNPASLQTKAIKALKADHFIAMSGTPVENRLLDYWSIMDFTNKGLLGTKSNFFKVFDKPISKDKDKQVLAKFRKITNPFLMRRMKTDKTIITDLPDKIVQDTFAFLTKEQAALYEKVVQEGLELIENQKKDDSNAAFKRQGLILQMILSLKQICNHPANWLKSGINDVSLSGKSDLLMSLISSIIDSGDKVIIFTQFKEMGDILCEQIHHTFGFTPLWLHGGVNMMQRKTMVEDFQNLPNKKVMVLSLKAGGTGLNLTAANHVIHYDLWWNPAVENQATDRAFRIGQKKNVMVHRFITKNTFEEKINDLINSKKDLADIAVTTGERWIGELSDRDIKQLFKRD
jgi:SNF2 family DNA or RNA helicase/uncharacterized Zn finger protein